MLGEPVKYKHLQSHPMHVLHSISYEAINLHDDQSTLSDIFEVRWSDFSSKPYELELGLGAMSMFNDKYGAK